MGRGGAISQRRDASVRLQSIPCRPATLTSGFRHSFHTRVAQVRHAIILFTNFFGEIQPDDNLKHIHHVLI